VKEKEEKKIPQMSRRWGKIFIFHNRCHYVCLYWGCVSNSALSRPLVIYRQSHDIAARIFIHIPTRTFNKQQQQQKNKR
jgi:hypothetical protein